MKSIPVPLLLVLLLAPPPLCQSLTFPSNTAPFHSPRTNNPPRGTKESFSVPLLTERPAPTTVGGTLNQLWNDPRPVTRLIGDAVANEETAQRRIPYCLESPEFIIQKQHKFRILLYPRGRLVGASSQQSTPSAGPAAAYLQYITNHYGDEVDISWKLRLVDTSKRDNNNNTAALALPVLTSGGLPRSNTTWSAAMTLCSEMEAVESLGRVSDWGSSTWYAESVCDALGSIQAEGEITIHNSRTGESSFVVPPKGAVRAVLDATGSSSGKERTFRVGQVIVPMKNTETQQALEQSLVYPGTDYRIMTMADQHGAPIFSTRDVPPEERNRVQLALRPCGWKLQQQLWQDRSGGKEAVEWPVQVPAGLLSQTALTRFNWATAFPRVAATFQRDTMAVLLGVALALAPLPGALIVRNFVSFYAIPSASMDPTLIKGDVLLVEKLPGVFDRTQRGDVVLFRPPLALQEIIGSNNNNAIGNSLFVKRVVGIPGDKNIVLDPVSKEVTVDGSPSMGPDRNLCEDEPLRLIDRLLENGKGKNIAELSEADVYVVGDCKGVSVDSRVFGVLPKENIEGRPIGRIWPPSRVTFRKL